MGLEPLISLSLNTSALESGSLTGGKQEIERHGRGSAEEAAGGVRTERNCRLQCEWPRGPSKRLGVVFLWLSLGLKV